MFKNLFAFDSSDWAIVDRFFGRGFIINGTGFGFAIITEREDGWGSTDAETAGDASCAVHDRDAVHDADRVRFADRGAEILNRFIESLAVMIVTSCVIPILVLLFSLWIINQVFGFSIPTPSRHPRLRPHLPTPRRTLGSGSSAPDEPEDDEQE